MTRPWKRAGVLVKPNGITTYSQWPVGVLNAVFHWSPSLMRTRWYALRRSNFVKVVAPCRSSNAVIIRGRGVPVLFHYVVDSPIIDTWTKQSVLLPYEEEPSFSEWQGGTDDASCKSVPEVFLHRFHLRSRQQEQMTSGGCNPGLEIYGTDIGSVRRQTGGTRLLKELATSGRETSTRGITQRAAAPVSKKLSSAPESSSADVFFVLPVQFRVTGRQVRLRVENSIGITPTSAPRSTIGCDPFTGHFVAKCPAPPQYRHAQFRTHLSRSSFVSLDRSTIITSISVPDSFLIGDCVEGGREEDLGRFGKDLGGARCLA